MHPGSKLFDGPIEYATWTDGPYTYKGMRHSESQKPHGICRRVDKGSSIIEAQWLNGQMHGLALWWWNDGCFYASIYREDNRIASYGIKPDQRDFK